jgi:type II secretory pathway component PulK
MINFSKQKGSVAIMTILLVSAVVLILVVSMSESNISSSYHQLNIRSDRSMYYGAETCLEEALIRLKKDSSFSSTEIDLEENHTCSVNVSGSTLAIEVNYFGYRKNFSGEFSASFNNGINHITLLNWTEI